MSELEVLENREELLRLLDLYGALLSEAQRDALSLYLRFDLSISEISEEKGYSRAAAFDALKKGEEKLRYYEQTLGMLQKEKDLDEFLSSIEAAGELEDVKKAVHAWKEKQDNGI